jgi:arylsulfatase A-like enzyme
MPTKPPRDPLSEISNPSFVPISSPTTAINPTAFLLALCALLFQIGTATAEQKPNVIFIVCDDLNTHVSSSGYPHIRPPSFARLAESGMTFSTADCQYQVCGPSRASFLSGLYPQPTGVLDNEADIRTDRWRYTLWPDGEELYDLNKDVEEHHNLAKIPEQKENLEKLRSLLKQTEKRAASLAN